LASYRKFKVFNPDAMINKYRDVIIEMIDTKELDIKLLSNYISELKNYSEESFSKNELSVSKYILRVYEEIIIHLIECKDKLILSKDDDCNNEVAELEKELFNAIMLQIKSCSNYNCINLLEDIFDAIESIMIKCVKCEKIKMFNTFCNMIDNIFSYSMLRQNSICSNIIISLYGNISKKVLSIKDIGEEWLTALVNKFKHYGFESYIHMNENVLKKVYFEYFYFAENCIKTNKFSIYDILFEDIIRLVCTSIAKENYSVHNFLKLHLIKHTYILIDMNNNDLIEKYIENLNKIGNLAFDLKNEDLCLCVLDIFEQILEEYKDDCISKIISKSRYDFTLKSISVNEELVVIFMPDYVELLSNNLSDIDLLDKVLKEYEVIIKRVFLRKDINIVVFLLDKLNSIIMIYNKDKRAQQERILAVYKKALFICLNMKSSEKFHIVLDCYSYMFRKIDKADKISEEFSISLLKTYIEISKLCINMKQIDFCISIINELYEINKKLLIVNKRKEFSLSVIKIMFRIGVNAVENDMEDIIKNVSNNLGWIAMSAIENKDVEILKSVLDSATKLTNICIEFEIHEKTIVFIGTLFIILGGCACSRDNIPYMNSIISSIKNIRRLDFLNKSILLRQCESQSWNEHMNNNAGHYMKKFYKNLSI